MYDIAAKKNVFHNIDPKRHNVGGYQVRVNILDQYVVRNNLGCSGIPFGNQR